MTIKQIVYDILMTVRGGTLSDDDYLKVPQLQFNVDNVRAMLISQQLAKRLFIPEQIKQTLSCVDVSLVDKSECPCEVTGCSIFRTDLKIPKTIETHGRNIIQVGSIMIGTKPYHHIDINRTAYIDSAKFGKDYIKWFSHNDYIYIITKNFTDKISIVGVFETPAEANKFSHCNGQPCYDENTSRYPVSGKMIEDIKNTIFNTSLRIEANSIGDDINNADGRVNTGSRQAVPKSTQQAQTGQEE